MHHALVVGGTGMLAGVSRALALRAQHVSVVARDPARIEALARTTAGQIHGVPVDYRDLSALRGALTACQEASGPIELAVSWIHSVAPEGPWAVAESLQPGERPASFVHVLGSAAADPSRPAPERRERFEALDHIAYQEVVLGFVIEDASSRWLTHEEICAGVLDAVDSGRPRTTVGVVVPWSRRP